MDNIRNYLKDRTVENKIVIKGAMASVSKELKIIADVETYKQKCLDTIKKYTTED
jgi:hypothetical protein